MIFTGFFLCAQQGARVQPAREGFNRTLPFSLWFRDKKEGEMGINWKTDYIFQAPGGSLLNTL